ncbi:MAG: hypothetical protein ACI4RM_06555 [Ruminococcus sp.]
MDNPNTISYADDWKEAYNPVYKEEKPDNEVIEKKKEKNKTGKPLLIIIQLIVFTVIVLSAYCIKTFGGDLYNTLHQWYYNTLNDQIILTESFDSFSIDKVFDNSEQS